MRAERTLVVIRDMGCILVGLGGIVWQTYKADADPVLLGVFMSLLFGPPALAASLLRKNIGTHTTGESLHSQPEQPSSPRPTPLSGQ